MNKSLILEIEETKTDILQAVNYALNARQIPCYFLKDILFDIASQVAKKANAEVEHLKKNEREAAKKGGRASGATAG